MSCKAISSTACIYLSRSTCIYENLAFEEWLFRNHNLNENGEAMLIWSNTPSVVIGKHQNPWLEVDIDYLHKNGINLARRYSGGGTVYHDLGEITIELNQRDDLLLQPGDRKISGTAARIAHGQAYHHLTLLIRPDLPVLRRVLQSPLVDKIETNATRSVRAKAVGQLSDAVPELESKPVIDVIVKEVRGLTENTDVFEIDSNEIKNEQKWNDVGKTKDELKSSEWIFGKSPKFTIQLPDSNDQNKKVVVEHGRVIESQNDLYEIGLLFDRIKKF